MKHMKFYIFKSILINYRPQRSCGQGNVFTGVCLSKGGEGACWDARTPPPPPSGPGRPPCDQADTPQDQADTPPDQADTTPQDQAGLPLGPGRPPRTRQTTPTPHLPGPDRPPPGSSLQHTVYERPVRILLECILVFCCILLFLTKIQSLIAN